jgi:hypothetical protein
MHEAKQALDSNNSSTYRRATLRGIFVDEVDTVLQSLERLTGEIITHTDTLFDQRESYINYIAALTEALANMDPDLSIPLWQQVDVQWMSITGPIQMVHPFESYLDNLRSTVGLQFDVRMKLPNAGVSQVRDTMEQMVLAVARDFPEISPHQIALWIGGLNKKTVYFVGLPIHG